MPTSSRDALAYLLTWTTYGTWLRGDRRGYVGRSLAGEGPVSPKLNVFGTPYQVDDGRTFNWDANAMKGRPVCLTSEQAACAAEALCDLAARVGYDLLCGAVMRDHVHLLVAAHPHGKNEIMRRFKSVSAVRLTQHFGHPPAKAGDSLEKGGRWWTREGSKREKRDEAAVAAAIEYVAEQADKLAEIVDGTVVRKVVGVCDGTPRVKLGREGTPRPRPGALEGWQR
jgi:REP element-mobilizing transposase RayT